MVLWWVGAIYGRFSGRFRRSGRIPNVLYVRSISFPVGVIYGRITKRFRRSGRIPDVQNVQNVRSRVAGGAYSWADLKRPERSERPIKIFWKKMRFTYWRQKNTALYIRRGRIIRKNINVMYVVYVQTTLIQTDTNDTMYQRKTVKFVFWENSFFLRYHIYNLNRENVGVSTISRFLNIPHFRNEIPHLANEVPHFRERDTT